MRPGQKAASTKWRQSPKGKYAEQKRRAKARGIAFLLSFEEWWQIWQDSGFWELRGNRYGRYVMQRCGDEGPYATWNVYIGPFSVNALEGLPKATRARLAAQKKRRMLRDAAEHERFHLERVVD